MTDPLTRIRRGAIVLAGFSLFVVFGHHWLTQRSWLESVYWFVITIATVGYGERSTETPAVMAFTIFAILVGVSLAGYVIGNFLQLLAEGVIERTLGVRRMHHQIDQLNGHTIVCGYGRLGKTLAKELSNRNVPFIVIEHHSEEVAEAAGTGYLFLTGDATDENMLLQAGIQRAGTLIVALDTDADNVFLTLTARNLNPKVRIIARGEQPSTEKKLLQAGADRVVLPAVLGARRMATMVSHPHAAEVVDLVSDYRALNASLEELRVTASTPWAGKSIRDAGTRTKHRLLIVAVRRADGSMEFIPDPTFVMQPGDTAIVMGKREDIESFLRDYQF
jgi:voltage-gated potassium channel